MLLHEVYPTHQQREAAKRILCALIQTNGGTFESQTRLYKAFYWAHLHFWQNADGLLTHYPIARMPFGPGIDDGENLLFEMQAQGLIEIDDPNPEDEHADRIFRLITKFQVNLNSDELKAVRHGLEKVRGKSAGEVSRETHAKSRSWKRKRNGQILNIYEDLLSQEEFDKTQHANAEAASVIDELFN